MEIARLIQIFKCGNENSFVITDLCHFYLNFLNSLIKKILRDVKKI